MQVGADDGGAEMDLFGLTREVQRKEQRRGEVAMMNVGVMLGEEGASDAQVIGDADQVSDFLEDLGARSGDGAFKVVCQADVKHGVRVYTDL